MLEWHGVIALLILSAESREYSIVQGPCAAWGMCASPWLRQRRTCTRIQTPRRVRFIPQSRRVLPCRMSRGCGGVAEGCAEPDHTTDVWNSVMPGSLRIFRTVSRACMDRLAGPPSHYFNWATCTGQEYILGLWYAMHPASLGTLAVSGLQCANADHNDRSLNSLICDQIWTTQRGRGGGKDQSGRRYFVHKTHTRGMDDRQVR